MMMAIRMLTPTATQAVDKGKVVTNDGGPMSQMQKIALQNIN
jgi:hypothetical protein